jgi:GTP-binding protein Era
MSFKAGIVAMLGRPNVGKSTLLNQLVGQKVSIVSNKVQTTRRRALGIDRSDTHEIVFIDTPGIHEPHTRLGRAMVEEARNALAGVDAILFVADSSKLPNDLDKHIASLVEGIAPVVVCLNKMDKLPAENVIKHVEAYCKLLKTEDYMLTRADLGFNIEKLREMVVKHLPEGEPQYDEDTYTDQSVRFMASEFIREQVLKNTRQEVPHAVAVLIEDWDESQKPLYIAATILVEKQGQKAILIGNRGESVKKIGMKAREEIEKLLGERVFLELNVRVRENWRMNPSIIREAQGFND